MLDLTHEHQISICFLLFHNNHRLRYGLTPGIVKLWQSPQQSWGFIDDYYQWMVTFTYLIFHCATLAEASSCQHPLH
jgi:hypothetical protein